MLCTSDYWAKLEKFEKLCITALKNYQICTKMVQYTFLTSKKKYQNIRVNVQI